MSEANAAGDFLEATAKGVALAVVLLPISGVVLRWIAFQSGVPLNLSGDQLAWAAPVGQLAATGFFGLFPWIIVFGGLPLILIWVNRRPFFRHRQHHTAVEIFTDRGILASWVALVIFLALVASFPSTALGAASGLIGNISSWLSDKPQPLKLRHLWPIVVVMLLSGSLASGLNGRLTGIESGDYTFIQPVATAIGDGRYVQVGESGDLAYLFNCRGAGQIVGVAKSSVLSVSFKDSPRPHLNQPSLLGVLLRHQKMDIGFHPPC